MEEAQKLFRIAHSSGYGFQSTMTVFEVDTMGRSSGGGGRSGGASGGGGGVNQNPLGPSNEQRVGGGLSDDGNLLVFQNNRGFDTNDVDTGSARADNQMVAAFNRGEINTTAALVIETGPDSYRAVDPTSARIIASARESGQQANVIQVPRSQLESARATANAAGSPSFRRVNRSTGGLSETGNLLRLPANEISGGRTTASQSNIDRAARSIRNNNGSTWVSVPVRQTGLDRYEVVGNGGNALAIARRANTQVNAYIVE